MNEADSKLLTLAKATRFKISFFVKFGLDNFLEDIITGLQDEYEIKKVIVTNLKQIDDEMKWADICWFEWCDELVAYGSKLSLAEEKKIICRLHSYEAFTNYPSDVNWDNVDKLIFVGDHLRNFILDNFSIEKDNTVVISNGVCHAKWSFEERKPGFNIAYAGYINYKKGPMLLLHTFKAIFDKDNRYKLFIAGEFQDHRDVLYFQQMIKEFGMEKNIIFQGWQDNLDKWLEDKNYILCTSILESQNMSIMQAMAKGIKPIIHNFVGAKNIYPNSLIWNTINEAIDMITSKEYYSQQYCDYIKNNFEMEDRIEEIKTLLVNINETEMDIIIEQPLVTIGITNYNGRQYLAKCIDSFINQTYKNIEILLIDDCSTDGSDEMIRVFEEKYDNIHAIYHNVNSGGASKGIQEIIEIARGKYFQWIACDDFVFSDAVYRFVSYLEKHPEKDYVFSDFNIVDENSITVEQWNYKLYPHNKVIEHIFKSASGLIPMNCLYRLSFFRDNKINWLVYRDNDFSADTLNSLQFIKYNWNYGKLNSTAINYRIHSDNLSYNLKKRISSSISIFDYVIKNFKEEVYFPEIQWDQLEDRNDFKNYIIAEFYYKQIQNHLSMKAIPEYIRGNVKKEELLKYCYVFAEEGIKYINESLTKDSKYLNEFLSLKKLYESYIAETKSIGVI